MRLTKNAPILATAFAIALGFVAQAAVNNVEVRQSASDICIRSNGLPDHSSGWNLDGTYNRDFEFVHGYGNLDECNGARVDGTDHHFATDTYPFFPRCLFGTEITIMS